MPKVSVIIPNYNHVHFLQQRIDSVINQTYQDFEVIILDDCSTDNSIEVIELYREHPKVSQIVYNKVNSGTTFKQWKKGIELAQGEFIWIAESDDWADSAFLLNLINYITEHGLRIAYCESKVFETNNQYILGSTLLPEIYPKINWKKNNVIKGGSSSCQLFAQTSIIYNASAVLFHKSLVQYLPDSLNYKLVGDVSFWAKIILYEKIGFYQEPLNYFRTHTLSVRQKIKENSPLYLYEHYKLFSWISEKTQNSIILENFAKQRAFRCFELLIHKFFKAESKTFLPLLRILASNPRTFYFYLKKKLV